MLSSNKGRMEDWRLARNTGRFENRGEWRLARNTGRFENRGIGG